MAYALHRRTAFRQGGGTAGWAFDLSKSTYLDSASLLNQAVGTIGGTLITPRRLFLSGDSSFLLAQSLGYIYRYNFPSNHFGDIHQLQNAQYNAYSDRAPYINSEARCIAFSQNGLHYLKQGDSSSSTNYNIYSKSLDSAFDIASIPSGNTGMNVFSEYTQTVPGLAFSADGLFLLVMGTGSFRSYYLSEPFDVSSASLVFTQVTLTRFVASCGISAVVSHPNYFRDWQFSPDGFTLVALWSYGNSSYTGVFFVFKLSAPFNLSTIALDHIWDLGTNYVNGFAIDRDGHNLYVARSTTVQQYALSA